VLVAWAATVVLFMAGFVIIPHIPTYLVHNLDFPEDGLGFLYLVGGAVSFFTMRLVGSLVDRVGSVPIAAIGAAVMVPLVYEGFARVPPLVPVLLLFVLFMAGMNFRMISYNALASRVPRPAERARFASINSSIQHLSAAAGGVLSWQILVEAPDRSLVGMPTVAYVAMALFAAGPAAVLAVERMLGREGAND
jgi:predicted MFS family arabinose efflux permease